MKKLKICLGAVIAFFLSFESFAQETKVGVRLGVGLPSIESTDDNIFSTGFETVAGFDGGAFLDLGITNNFSLKFELAYARKGGVRNGLQPIPPPLVPPEFEPITQGEIIYADFDNTAVFSYITVPILAKYEWHLDEKWGVYANAGVYLDFIVQPRQETAGTTSLFFDPDGNIPVQIPINPQDPPQDWVLVPVPPIDFTNDTDLSEDLESINFGVMLGGGVTYAVSPKSELLFDIRGAYGFIPVQKDTETYGEVNIGSVVFSLGYAITLGK